MAVPLCRSFAVNPVLHLPAHAASVVCHRYVQYPIFMERVNTDVAVSAAVQPMDDGVFNQGLQDHLGHHAVLQLVRYLCLIQEPPCKTYFLYLHIALDGFKLLSECDKGPAGYAFSQNDSQVFRQHCNLRNLVDSGVPLDGIQGIIEKMRVQLGLVQLKRGLI